MSAPNVCDPRFDEPREHPGFNVRRARVGRQAGSRRLGASLWELPPGQAAYPYQAPPGEQGVRFLALPPNGEPDVVLYPDAGKVGVNERRPDGAGFGAYFFGDHAVDYWEGVDA